MSEAEIQTVEIDWHREAYAKLDEAYRLLVAENLRLKDALTSVDKTLESCEAAMTYAYEDRNDQYYLNVKNVIQAQREALKACEVSGD